MIIYKDIVSGDELFSDGFPFTLVDDLYYEVYGKYTTEVCDEGDSGLGGNISEDPAETTEQIGIRANIVEASRLHHCFQVSQEKYLSEEFTLYVKFLLDFYGGHSSEKGAPVKERLKKITVILREKLNAEKFQFFQGRSQTHGSMIALLGNKEIDGREVPYMIFFKDGLKTEIA